MVIRIDLEELKTFIIEAHQHGYAAGDRDKWIKEPDGSTSIYYERGPWKYHDNFFGGEPYGGREVIFYKGHDVWMMSYYGRVQDNVDPHRVYPCLRRAILTIEDLMPVRGPITFLDPVSKLTYKVHWSGDLESFNGMEWIKKKENSLEHLYCAHFQGGWINRR